MTPERRARATIQGFQRVELQRPECFYGDDIAGRERVPSAFATALFRGTQTCNHEQRLCVYCGHSMDQHALAAHQVECMRGVHEALTAIRGVPLCGVVAFPAYAALPAADMQSRESRRETNIAAAQAHGGFNCTCKACDRVVCVSDAADHFRQCRLGAEGCVSPRFPQRSPSGELLVCDAECSPMAATTISHTGRLPQPRRAASPKGVCRGSLLSAIAQSVPPRGGRMTPPPTAVAHRGVGAFMDTRVDPEPPRVHPSRPFSSSRGATVVRAAK